MACGLQPSAAAAVLQYSRRSGGAAAAKGRPHQFNSTNQLHRRLPLFESHRFRNLVSSRCSDSSAEAAISSRPADVSSAHNDLTTRRCMDDASGHTQEHIDPSEETLLATPDFLRLSPRRSEAGAALLLLGEEEQVAPTPPPEIPAPGNLSQLLPDEVAPAPALFSDAVITSVQPPFDGVDPALSPLPCKRRERGLIEVFDVSVLFPSPPPPVFVPHDEVVEVLERMEEGPRRSKRVASQGDGSYVTVADKAMKKKARELLDEEQGKQQMLQKGKTAASSSSGPVQPELELGDLIYLGERCGFEQGELIDVVNAASKSANK